MQVERGSGLPRVFWALSFRVGGPLRGGGEQGKARPLWASLLRKRLWGGGGGPRAELGRAGAEGPVGCEEGGPSSFVGSERDVEERVCFSYRYVWRPLGTGSVAGASRHRGRSHPSAGMCICVPVGPASLAALTAAGCGKAG